MSTINVEDKATVPLVLHVQTVNGEVVLCCLWQLYSFHSVDYANVLQQHAARFEALLFLYCEPCSYSPC